MESWTNASTSAKLFKNNSTKLMVIGSNKEVRVLAVVVLKGWKNYRVSTPIVYQQ